MALFQSTSGQTFNEAALEEEKEGNDGQHDDHASRVSESPVAMKGLLESQKAGGNRQKRVALDKCNGIDEFIPGRKTRDQAHGQKAGQGQRENNARGDLKLIGAIDACGLAEIARDTNQVGAQQENGQRTINGAIDDNQAEQIVGQIERTPGNRAGPGIAEKAWRTR